MATLEDLKERRKKIQEAIDNTLEGGQEIQTRTGRVKMVSFQSLQQQLASVETAISDRECNDYTDTECFVFRGCR